MEPTGRANARPMINSAIPIASPCWYPESQTCIAAHPSRRPRSLSSGRALRGPVGGLLRMRSNFVETQQPHAEERATRASRSMGNKRLTYLSQWVLAHDRSDEYPREHQSRCVRRLWHAVRHSVGGRDHRRGVSRLRRDHHAGLAYQAARIHLAALADAAL